MSLDNLLDPEIAQGLQAIPAFTISNELLPAMRAQPPVEIPLSDSVERTDHMVPGDPDVRVRTYRCTDVDGDLPCIFSMHGGGYILGTVEREDILFDYLCTDLGVVGVSVDYRLAPETSYPDPLEDCYRALVWTFENAHELRIDRQRIGIRGTSAGGGLAAALALLARDRDEVDVAFQALDSPMLDDRQMTHSSQQDGLAIWNRHSNEFGWRSYLGDLYGSDDVPAYAAPARAGDLTGLPPAFMSVGALDGFRDEVVDYATRLNQAGVPTELHVYPGAPHGYQLAGNTAIARQAKRDADEWIARQIS